MKVVVIKDLSIWVTQCGHGREALKISRSASKITFPVLSILRLKTLPNSIFPHYSTGRAKKSRSIKSWQLSRIRWFTAYLVFGRLGFWIEGRLFCSEGLVRLAKSKKRPRKSFLVLVCFGFGLLGFELENVSARKVWSDWRRVRRGRADPLQADGAAQRPQRHDSITYCPLLDICFEKMVFKSNTALLWTSVLKKWSSSQMLPSFGHLLWKNGLKVKYCPPLDIGLEKMVFKSNAALFWTFALKKWSQSQELPCFGLFWRWTFLVFFAPLPLKKSVWPSISALPIAFDDCSIRHDPYVI